MADRDSLRIEARFSSNHFTLDSLGLDIESPHLIEACTNLGYSPTDCVIKKKRAFRKPVATQKVVNMRYEHYLRRTTTMMKEIIYERRRLMRRGKDVMYESCSPKERSMEASRSNVFLTSMPNTMRNSSQIHESSLSMQADIEIMHEKNIEMIKRSVKQKVLDESKQRAIDAANSKKQEKASKQAVVERKKQIGPVEMLNKKCEIAMEKKKEIQEEEDLAIKKEKERQMKDNKKRLAMLAEMETERRKEQGKKEKQYRRKMKLIQEFHDARKEKEMENMLMAQSKIIEKTKRSELYYETKMKEKTDKMHERNMKITLNIENISRKQKEQTEDRIQLLENRDKETNKRLERKVKEITQDNKLTKDRLIEKEQAAATCQEMTKNEEKEKIKQLVKKMKNVESTVNYNQKKLRDEFDLKIEKEKLKEQDMEENKKRCQRLHQAKVNKLLQKYHRLNEWLQVKREEEELIGQQRKNAHLQAQIEREKMMSTLEVFCNKPLNKTDQKKVIESLGMDYAEIEAPPTKGKDENYIDTDLASN